MLRVPFYLSDVPSDIDNYQLPVFYFNVVLAVTSFSCRCTFSRVAPSSSEELLISSSVF